MKREREVLRLKGKGYSLMLSMETKETIEMTTTMRLKEKRRKVKVPTKPTYC